jgi:hypothetical protein
MLVVELILHGTHHGTALPLSSSSWQNIVVPILRVAAFEAREIWIPHAIVTPINSHGLQKIFNENHCINTKC